MAVLAAQRFLLARFGKTSPFFLADNILSSPSTQQNTNHPCNLIWSDTNDPYNLKSFIMLLDYCSFSVLCFDYLRRFKNFHMKSLIFYRNTASFKI